MGCCLAKSLPKLEEAVICDVCEERIINSQWQRFNWGQTLCKKHKFDETPVCYSCSRYKIRNIEFITLNDGRYLCPDCHSTAILDSESCYALVSEIHNFYGGLNMHIRKDIPVLLLDQIETTRLAENPNTDQVVAVGLTIYNEREAITCVKGSSQIGTNIEVLTQVVNLPRHCPVTGMLLLYGYPKLHIGATLAHEMMHTWMTLQGYPELELKTKEGICELMAYKYLESYDFSGEDMNGADQRSHQFMRNLKEYLMKQMEGNGSKIYGDGFREAKLAAETHGFDYTIKYIFDKGKFPK